MRTGGLRRFVYHSSDDSGWLRNAAISLAPGVSPNTERVRQIR